MTASFVFCLVCLIISLILLIIGVFNIYYFNLVKNGTLLTSTQSNALSIVNILGVILLFGLFIYAIFATVQASRAPEVVVSTTQMTPSLTLPQAAQVAYVAPAVAVPRAPVAALPANVDLVGPAPAGVNLFRTKGATSVPAGTLLAVPAQ